MSLYALDSKHSMYFVSVLVVLIKFQEVQYLLGIESGKDRNFSSLDSLTVNPF